MSSVPSLKTIEGALERVHRQAPFIADKAAWVWPWGYDRRRGETSGSSGGEVSRPTEAAVGHDRWLLTRWAEDGTRLAVPRPASAEWIIRTEKEHAGRFIMQAAALLEAAEGALDKASKAAGRGDQVSASKQEQLPRTVTKAEVNKAKQMKRWRIEERAKGVGHGTY